MMKKSRLGTASRLFTARAPLAAIGLKLRSLKIFDVISRHVQIKQKTIKHTPPEKLQDAFIAILSGAHGLSEINTRVRADVALQRAFGRSSCAEQSVVQETLDACSLTNVSEMQAALDETFRRHSRGYRHNNKKCLQVLDIDMTGMPCGPKAERATKGYFDYHSRYGRQMGRVMATQYDEVVVDRLYPGNVQLSAAVRQLVEAAEQTLELDEAKRARTVIRMDSGGGGLNTVNWLLGRGYQVHGKDYSTRRAATLAKYVRQWVADPDQSGRELGWVVVKSVGYVREVRRLVMKWRRRNGQVCYATLLSTLSPSQVMALAGWADRPATDETTLMAAYARAYDKRGGAVEIDIKESKQGLGITKRNKKRFYAQKMVMMLGTLAHNCIIWAKRWLEEKAPKLKSYGVKRMVRDVFAVSGFLEVKGAIQVTRLVINGAASLGRQCAKALKVLLKPEHVAVILAET